MEKSKYILISVLIALTLGIFYLDTVVSIVDIWVRSETFAHGFLILPISAYMVWIRRESLKYIQVKPALPGVLFLAIVAITWSFAYAGNILSLEQIAFYLFIPVLVYTVFGFAMFKGLAFPLTYLVFAIPFGEELIPVLQDFTAYFTVKALQLSGIPVFWEGLFITIPTGKFEVAKACSGIRYLFASLALGTFYAYITYTSYLKRTLFIIASIVVPLIANGIRAYGVVMIAHLSDHKYATGFDHLVYGWLFFGIIMFVLFWVGNYWREGQTDTPVTHSNSSVASTFSNSIIAISILILASGPAVKSWIAYKEGQELVANQYKLPDNINGWKSSGDFRKDWQPTFIGADDRILASYNKGGQDVHVVVFSYQRQKQGKEMINFLNKIYNDKEWHLVNYFYRNNDEQPVIEERIRSKAGDLLSWRWYQVNNVNVANKYIAKLLDAYVRIFSNTPSYTYVIATNINDDSGDEYRRLQEFMRVFKPVISKD